MIYDTKYENTLPNQEECSQLLCEIYVTHSESTQQFLPSHLSCYYYYNNCIHRIQVTSSYARQLIGNHKSEDFVETNSISLLRNNGNTNNGGDIITPSSLLITSKPSHQPNYNGKKDVIDLTTESPLESSPPDSLFGKLRAVSHSPSTDELSLDSKSDDLPVINNSSSESRISRRKLFAFLEDNKGQPGL